MPTDKSTSTTKKTSKPKPKTQKGMSDFQKSILIVSGVFLTLLFLGIGYVLGGGNEVAEKEGYKTAQEYSIGELLNDLSDIKSKEVKEEPKKAAVKKKKETTDKKVAKEEVLTATGTKPKLSIIMDDISREVQLKAMQALKMKITPSIFPPSELSMTSHELAKGLNHFMIHIPMQSGNKKLDKHYKTLKTTATKDQIIARVKELRKFFPTGTYVNNHTGSMFVADYKAMHILYEALREEGFLLLDSKTGSNGKILQISSEFSDKYMARDVFIDNEKDVPYIHKQLEKAVKIAKNKGQAIAIAHPHKVTFEALKTAEKIFKDVELVYLDTIYKK